MLKSGNIEFTAREIRNLHYKLFNSQLGSGSKQKLWEDLISTISQRIYLDNMDKRFNKNVKGRDPVVDYETSRESVTP